MPKLIYLFICLLLHSKIFLILFNKKRDCFVLSENMKPFFLAWFPVISRCFPPRLWLRFAWFKYNHNLFLSARELQTHALPKYCQTNYRCRIHSLGFTTWEYQVISISLHSRPTLSVFFLSIFAWCGSTECSCISVGMNAVVSLRLHQTATVTPPSTTYTHMHIEPFTATVSSQN